MANNTDLKAAIAAVVETNGNNEITGQLMQDALFSIINQFGEGSLFMGVASVDTNPGNPDVNQYWVAADPGVYPNFNGLTLIDGIAFINNISGSWVSKIVRLPNFDTIKRIAGGENVNAYYQGGYVNTSPSTQINIPIIPGDINLHKVVVVDVLEDQSWVLVSDNIVQTYCFINAAGKQIGIGSNSIGAYEVLIPVGAVKMAVTLEITNEGEPKRGNWQEQAVILKNAFYGHIMSSIDKVNNSIINLEITSYSDRVGLEGVLVGIKDVSISNITPGRVYFFKTVAAPRSSRYQIIIASSLPNKSDVRDECVFSEVVGGFYDGAENYYNVVLSPDANDKASAVVTVCFKKYANNYSYDGLATGVNYFSDAVFKGGNYISTYNNKPFIIDFEKTQLSDRIGLKKVIKGIKDMSLNNTVSNRIYYIKNIYTPTVSNKFQIVINSCLTNKTEDRPECYLLLDVADNNFKVYEFTKLDVTRAGGKININFKILENELTATGYTGQLTSVNYFTSDVFNGGKYLSFSITKVSEIINDSDFVSRQYVDDNFDLYVTEDHLTENYSDNDQLNALVSNFVTDSELNSKVFQNEQIGSGAIEAGNIAQSVWDQMTGGNVSIINNPDNIDIESNGGLLRLRDRQYSIDNYGYKFVRDTVLTQTIVDGWENCIVEIRKQHTLSSNVVLPSGVILWFNGGFITLNSNTITASNTVIKSLSSNYIFRGGTSENMKGSWVSNDLVYFEWFGAGIIDDSTAINRALSVFAGSKFSTIKGRNYVLNSKILVTGGSIIYGWGSTVERSSIPIDIKVMSAIVAGDTVTVLTLDNTIPAEIAKIKIGYQLEFVNVAGGARKYENYKKVVTAINGNIITVTGESPNSYNWAAETASVVNVFALFELRGIKTNMIGFTIDAKKSFYTHLRTYWEIGATIQGYQLINSDIAGNIISNSLADGIMTGGLNCRITNNYALHSGGNSLHLSGMWGALIQGNYFFDSNLRSYTGHNEGAITFSNEIYETRIVNNVFDTCLAGIGSIDSYFNSRVFISGNIFRRFKGDGIQCYSPSLPAPGLIDNIVIQSNRFYGSKRLDQTEETKYLPTLPEQVINSGVNGIVMSADPTGAYKSVIISNNQFIDCAVRVTNAEMLNINGNTFWDGNTVLDGSVPNSLVIINGCKGNFNGNYLETKSQVKRAYIFTLLNSPNFTISNCHIDSDKPVVNVGVLDLTMKMCKVVGSMTISARSIISNCDITGSVNVGSGATNDNIIVKNNEIRHVTNTITVALGVPKSIIKDNIFIGADIIDNASDTIKVGNIKV